MPNQIDTNLYDVLDVADDASADEITRAYKKLAREFHPDVNHDNPEAEDRFKEISAAYDVLGDADKRAEYDQFRSMVGQGFNQQGYNQQGYNQPGFGHGGFGGVHFDGADVDPSMMGDLGGLFSQMFGAAGPGGQRFQRPMTRIVRVEIDFADAVLGADLPLRLEDGTDLTVPIPAGADDGAQLVAKTPEGDLVVELRVGKDPTFGRSGRDLTIDVPIAVHEAVLGTKLKVPTFAPEAGNKTVSIRVPAGTSPGRTFRIKGRGIATSAGTGDLLVTVSLHIPTDLNDDQQAAMEAFAAASPELAHPNRQTRR